MSEEPIVNDSNFIETPDWIKNKKCTINPQNNDNKCFQYSVTLSLYHEQMTRRNRFRVSKIKPFVDNINWENINFPPQEQDHKTIKMNNKSTALNVLHADNEEKISQYYKSKFNKTREKQVILLIIQDNQKQRYLFVKNLNALLKKQYACSENYCINCLRPFRTKLRLKNIKKIVNHFHNQILIQLHNHQ